MKGNARNKYRIKAKQLLQLYSLWQETRSQEVEDRCMNLLREILRLEPSFNPRTIFQEAF